MARRTELVIARVIAAFARTGVEPCSGELALHEDDDKDEVTAACAVGATALDELGNALVAVFGTRHTCVAFGWDDAIDSNVHSCGHDRCPACQRAVCGYYEAGAAAAIAMGVA